MMPIAGEIAQIFSPLCLIKALAKQTLRVAPTPSGSLISTPCFANSGRRRKKRSN
jgi:hypothetical protein